MEGRGGGGACGMVAGMVVVQMLFSVLNILLKLALNDGMDARVLVAYCFMFAAVFLCPIAFFVERNTRPPLSKKVVLHLFFCGLFGFTVNQNLYVLAIKLTSATFITAIANLTPAATFILVFLTRLEALKLREPAGQAKFLRTLVSMGGAMLLTFYKGPEFKLLHRLPHPKLVHITEAHHSYPPSTGNQILGSFLGIIGCFSYATWLVIQAKVGEVYPCHYSIVAIVCVFGAIQSTIMGVCVQRDMEQWRLALNIRFYSSAYADSRSLYYHGVCERKAPYLSLFSPLMLIFIAVLSSLLLDEALYLGSVLGSILIVGGLYLVLWRKAKEQAEVSKENNLDHQRQHGEVEQISTV